MLAGSVISADADDQTDVHVAALAGGGFVAVWSEENGDGAGDGIVACIFDNDGDALDVAFIVNTPAAGSQFSPDVVGLRTAVSSSSGTTTPPVSFAASVSTPREEVGAEFEAGASASN